MSLMGYGLCAKCPLFFSAFRSHNGLDFGVGEDFMVSFIRVWVGLGVGKVAFAFIHMWMTKFSR